MARAVAHHVSILATCSVSGARLRGVTPAPPGRGHRVRAWLRSSCCGFLRSITTASLEVWLLNAHQTATEEGRVSGVSDLEEGGRVAEGRASIPGRGVGELVLPAAD